MKRSKSGVLDPLKGQIRGFGPPNGPFWTPIWRGLNDRSKESGVSERPKKGPKGVILGSRGSKSGVWTPKMGLREGSQRRLIRDLGQMARFGGPNLGSQDPNLRVQRAKSRGLDPQMGPKLG
jgi:hypothetical protein